MDLLLTTIKKNTLFTQIPQTCAKNKLRVKENKTFIKNGHEGYAKLL